MYSYKTRGTCSRSIQFDVVDGVVRDVRFEGGCNGNLKGIGRLVEGMPARCRAARGNVMRTALYELPRSARPSLETCVGESKIVCREVGCFGRITLDAGCLLRIIHGKARIT